VSGDQPSVPRREAARRSASSDSSFDIPTGESLGENDLLDGAVGSVAKSGMMKVGGAESFGEERLGGNGIALLTGEQTDVRGVP
jgi:hypothetical protein